VNYRRIQLFSVSTDLETSGRRIGIVRDKPSQVVAVSAGADQVDFFRDEFL